MMPDSVPDELPADSADRFDVFLSFTRASPGAEERTELVARALAARGLSVFRDVRIDEFDGITARLVGALAGSTVLLAYYTREFPTRYACQWELTMAFIAAQRYGDPRRRVLVINPEPPDDTSHLAPVELADAKFFGPLRGPADYERLAALVETKVRAARGPLGAAPRAVDPARLPAQVQRPREFAGRYREMWDVHTRLHAMDLTGVKAPDVQPAVMITGLAGAGKTSLAARYAYLYRDAYPGGIFWTGPFDGRSATEGTVLGLFTGQLREIAAEQLGLPVDGVEPARLRTRVADLITRAGRKVLWIVDDVPAGLTADALDQLLIPSPMVRTVLTGRIGAPHWEARTVPLGGLHPDDAVAVFFGAGESVAGEKDAVRALAERCGGHPMVIRAVANAVRNRRGLAAGSDLVDLLRNAAVTVTDAVERELGALDEVARGVVRVAATLAHAPFPPALAVAALGPTLSTSEGEARGLIGAAADQLAGRGLLHPVGRDWEIHPLVCDAVRGDAELSEVATGAATALLLLLTAVDPYLIRHAQVLGQRADLPATTRVRLLRCVADHQERQGDVEAAWATLDPLLAAGERGTTDLLSAARVGIACGRYEAAEHRARRAIELAAGTDDFRAAFRGRLFAAQALDHLGRYPEADETFWTEANAGLPGWLSTMDRLRAELAIALAKRVRGEIKPALEIVERVVVELRTAPPGGAREELTASAKLQLARLLQLTGKARVARDIAAEVVAYYQNAGMREHVRLLEARGIEADAYLTLDLTERDGKPENWQRSERELRELAGQYADRFGPDNVLALAARVRADRALLSIGEPERALAALVETERAIRHLGAHHELNFLVRHGMGLAHGQLREFAREREIFEELLPRAVAQFGKNHSATLEIQLELGIALMVTGQLDQARPLVAEAARGLRGVFGWTVDLSTKASVAQAMTHLPPLVLRSAVLVDQWLSSKKKSK